MSSPNHRRHRIGPWLRRHHHRRRLLTLGVLGLICCLWAWFAITKIYFPRLDAVPENTDVLVQLGGVPLEDYQSARNLARDQGIPDLVLSDPVGGTVVRDRYCGPLPGVRVHCFTPDPATTQGEARAFAALAEENGWGSAFILGTGREHVERVRFYFNRCWGGVVAVNRPASSHSLAVHLSQSWYQTAGWIRAIFTQCP